MSLKIEKHVQLCSWQNNASLCRLIVLYMNKNHLNTICDAYTKIIINEVSRHIA